MSSQGCSCWHLSAVSLRCLHSTCQRGACHSWLTSVQAARRAAHNLTSNDLVKDKHLHLSQSTCAITAGPLQLWPKSHLKLDQKMLPSGPTTLSPPPYSCMRVRALKPLSFPGSTSDTLPLGDLPSGSNPSFSRLAGRMLMMPDLKRTPCSTGTLQSRKGRRGRSPICHLCQTASAQD
jgi:hypothetical protein